MRFLKDIKRTIPKVKYTGVMTKLNISISKNWALLMLIMIFSSSCAGPHNPFGAINEFSSIEDQLLRNPSSVNSQNKNMMIKTFPEYQIYHRPYDLMVEVFDPEGIQDKNFSLDFYFNGVKVKDDWNIISYKKVGQNHLVAGIKNFRLLPQQLNIIGIVYSRHDNNKFYYYDYRTPECHLDGDSGNTLFGIDGFDVSRDLVGHIKDVTTSKNYSPSFLAALVAQESAFNPRAISWAKAIGLTQVTSLAQEHILTDKSSWPTYPNIAKLSYPKLRYLIMTNKIHAKNEWRLNERYSLEGGLEYVDYIKDYWKKDGNKNLLSKTFDQVPLTDIILASYNSGPYRVKKALKSLGDEWKTHDELGAAREYVSRVKSYCYEFSRDKGDL